MSALRQTPAWLAAAVVATIALTALPAMLPVTLVALATAWAGPALIAAGIVRHRPPGAAWRVVLAAMVLMALCRTIWWGPGLVGATPPPSPGVADALWTAGTLAMFAGLFLMLSPREDRTLLALDLSALVAAGALLIGGLLAGPYLTTTQLGSDTAVTAIVNAGGVALLAAMWIRMLLTPRPLPRAFVLVLVATGAALLSGVVWNVLPLVWTFELSTWVHAGWNVQPLLLGAAALHPSVREHPSEQTDFELHMGASRMLVVVVLSGPVLLMLHVTGAIATMEHPSAVATVGAGTLLVLCLASARALLLLSKSRDLQRALGEALARSDESLAATQERYASIIEGIPAVTFRAETGPAGVVPTYISPQIEELLGFTPEHWLATPDIYHRQIHPDDLPFVLERQAQIGRSTDGDGANEIRMIHADGHVVWIRQDVKVIPQDDRFVVQGYFLDISEHKSVEAERDQMEMELRLAQRLEAVGQLAAGVAHEINTPVQFVGDTVRFLDEAYKDLWELLGVYEELRAATAGHTPPELAERVAEAEDMADLDYLRERVPAAFTRAFDGVERVATIVRAMREFAHPPSSDQAPVDLNAAIRNTLTVARNEYKYVAEVVEELDAELPPVVANLGDLGQVLLNLVVNAAHAIQDGRVPGDDALGTIRITTRTDGEDVVVSVADTGCGIPPEVADRVFDPFFTTKEVGRGTGQGLAITRTIVDRHAGALTYETTPGAGTTFHVRLPVAGVSASASAATTPTLQEIA